MEWLDKPLIVRYFQISVGGSLDCDIFLFIWTYSPTRHISWARSMSEMLFRQGPTEEDQGAAQTSQLDLATTSRRTGRGIKREGRE